MNLRIILSRLLLLLSVLPLLAHAQNFEQTFSGWGMNSAEADSDDNQQGGVEATWLGKGKYGKSTNHVVLDSVWDGVSRCRVGDEDQPLGILLTVIANTTIQRTANGDLIYKTLSSSPPSTSCLNLSDQTVESQTYLDIVGGTGRFAGASGSTVLRYKVQILPGQNAIQGEESGHLNLLRGSD